MDALIRILWQQKWLILLITLSSLFIGGICIWKSTPVYEATAQVIAPTEGDIAGLNAGQLIKSLPAFSIKSTYRVFIQSLTSQAAQHAFNNAASQVVVKEEAYYSLKALPATYLVIAKAPTPAEAKDAVARYIDLANKRAMETVLAISATQKRLVLDNITKQIKMIRETAQKERDDQLVRLNEALQIATALGITSPSNDSTALYMQGSNALNMEIQKIADRESNDPYTPGLRALQSQYASLQGDNVNASEVKLFRLDRTIEASSNPVSPRKKLIFILFLILGLSFGSVVAILRELCPQKRRVASINSMCEGV